MTERVSILGDGAMATICANMLAGNGHAVRVWSAFPRQAAELAERRENRRFLPGVRLADAVEVTADAAAAFDGATLAWCATPTQYIRGVMERLAPHYPAGLAICSVAKGVETETLLRPSEILRERLGLGVEDVAVLSGPSIAPEIARGLPASVAVASGSHGLAVRVQQAISTPYFRVYTNADPVGVELAGATKNVIAIAAGMVDGLGLGDNAKAALVTRGLAEITRLGLAAGASVETFAGLAGLGDLVTTCISPVGRNRSLGEAIGRGKTLQQAQAATESVIEGVATTRSVCALAKRYGVEMPLTEAIRRVLFEAQPPRDALGDLMARPLRSELRDG